jgi:hypothetical protein
MNPVFQAISPVTSTATSTPLTRSDQCPVQEILIIRGPLKNELILKVVENPIQETVQSDGRIKRWAQIAAADGK